MRIFRELVSLLSFTRKIVLYLLRREFSASWVVAVIGQTHLGHGVALELEIELLRVEILA